MSDAKRIKSDAWEAIYEDAHQQRIDDLVRGGISRFTVPGRGTSYTATYGGHQVQVYVTEKRKDIRIFVDGEEWKP